MSQGTKKVRKTLRYWLAALRATENQYIKIDDDYWWGKPGTEKEEGYSVYIGDSDDHDYWKPQPYAWAGHKSLAKAIELALAKYHESERQFLMNQLK